MAQRVFNSETVEKTRASQTGSSYQGQALEKLTCGQLRDSLLKKSMTPQEALQAAADAGRIQQFDVSRHARQRMNERKVTQADLRAALNNATRAIYQETEDRWRLEGGADLDGDPLTLVVQFRPRCLLITVF